MEKQIFKTLIDIRKATGYVHGDLVACMANNYVYEYDSASDVTDDDETTLKPYNTQIGRWVKTKELEQVNLA